MGVSQGVEWKKKAIVFILCLYLVIDTYTAVF